MTARPTFSQVQETARWSAAARAVESERADALFHDRFARRFVGPEMDAMLDHCKRVGGTWPVVARTVLIDRLLMEAAANGADAVLNLAAGFDTRPYRLVFPRSLVWIDVDHTDIMTARTHELEREDASCVVEQRPTDLSDDMARRALFSETAARFQRLVVVTEGLLYYLSPSAALNLASELRTMHPLRWIFDLHNSAVLAMIRKRSGGALRGSAEMHFGPDEGAAIFEQFGWKIRSVSSSAKAAAGLGRLPFFMSLLMRLPAPTYGKPGWPWAGVCAAELGPDNSV